MKTRFTALLCALLIVCGALISCTPGNSPAEIPVSSDPDITVAPSDNI